LVTSDAAGSGIIGGTTLGSNGSAFFKLIGTDFITFDGFTIQELYTGATQNLKMQYGFELVRSSDTDGCKNVTISNCVINMQQSNVSSCGIATLNVNAVHTTTNPTTLSGRHENMSVQGCTISNSFNGMYFGGYASASPYDLYDNSYNIGTTSGNTLVNIGSGLGTTNTSTHYGIYGIYLDSVKINNNTIRINTGTNGATSYGMFLSAGLNSFVDIIGNTVSDTAGGLTNQVSGIACTMGGTGTSNVVNINNNVVQYCTAVNATTSNGYYIYIQANPFTLNMMGNTVRDNVIGGGATATGTGSQYGIYITASNTTTGATYNLSNNIVKKLLRFQSAAGAGSTYGIYMPGGGATTSINGNTVDSLYNSSTTGTLAGIYFSPIVTLVNVYNNTVSNLSKLTGSTTASLYGIYQSSSSATSNNYSNNVFNLSHNGTTGSIYGYYNNSSGTVAENVYNNTMHNFSSITSGVMIGIIASTGGSPIKDVYGNTVYNLIHSGTGQTGGIQVNYTATANVYKNKVYNIQTLNTASLPAAYGMLLNASFATVTYNVYNNMVSELYAPLSGTGLGVLGIWVNGGTAANLTYNTLHMDSTSTGTNFGAYGFYIAGTTIATLKNNILINKTVPVGTGSNLGIFKAATAFYDTISSNNNNIYVTPGAANFIYYDGTNTYQTFAEFQTRVAPAENNSFTENSPFINTSTHPYNVHLSTTTPTMCESRGQRILAPIAITDDFDGDKRWGESGYTGTGTAPDVGADEGNFIPLNPNLALNLKVYLEGFWSGTAQVVDTATVYLANATTPYALVDSAKVVLSTSGTASPSFTKVSTGSYYIVVKHRNHLETWSALPQSFVGGTPLSYDFTTAAAQAYGSNMKQAGSVWVLFGGDADRNGSIDADDIILFAQQFSNLGYLSCDFNGDGDVNASDVIIISQNFSKIKIVPGIAPSSPVSLKNKKIQTEDNVKSNINKTNISKVVVNKTVDSKTVVINKTMMKAIIDNIIDKTIDKTNSDK